MRRPSKNSSPRLSAESQRLVALAQGIVQSGSRLEARRWEIALDVQARKLLKNHHQAGIDHALDHLFTIEPDGYDALMEAIEAGSESVAIDLEGASFDALLIALPILAWTRFSIASGPVAQEPMQTLAAQLYAHVLADGARLAIAPFLYSIDQLPRNPTDTYALTYRMAQAALKNELVKVSPHESETAPFLADTRYVLGVVVVPANSALFGWQVTLDVQSRIEALGQWQAHASAVITPLLPGCGVELLLPQSYYAACREADRTIRPASIRAAVYFLTNTLEIEAQMLQAVIGAFSEDASEECIDEYRISFMLADDTEVVYGIVWPLYDGEGAQQELFDATKGFSVAATAGVLSTVTAPIDEIIELLREAGITQIHQHDERFLLEFCDDCGAPFYPDLEAELVHAEMPEDAPQPVVHFH